MNLRLGNDVNFLAIYLRNNLAGDTVSNRDEWVYDYSKEELNKKVKYFIKNYNGDLIKYSKIVNADNVGDLLKDSPIKYTRDLKKYLVNGKTIKEVSEEYRECLYRVFCKKNIYFDSALNEMRYQTPSLFPVKDSKNLLIAVNTSSKKFNVLASKYLVDLHFNGDSQCFALYYYDSNNNKRENITDWGLTKFQEYYKEKKIKKEDIFYYVYAVLHNPQYRKKYELNLKRDLPRIPLYDNFNKWSKWGKDLIELHLNFEDADSYNLLRKDEKPKIKNEEQKQFFPKVKEPEPMFGIKPKVKVKLKTDKENGKIFIDDLTTLSRIPKIAWEYKLGNRTAIEWILEQYKEHKPKDKTIAKKFNNYHFEDYKEEVIELIRKVCTVSLKTMEIVKQMEKGKEFV